MAVTFAREEKNPHFISFVISEMIAKSRAGLIVPVGVEHGFLSRIARLAYCGALN